jgi:hypothetical protein
MIIRRGGKILDQMKKVEEFRLNEERMKNSGQI